jgi:hypothetical protein
LATKTGEVNTKTGELVETITNKFLPAAADELSSVRDTTSEWGKKRDEIYKNIKANLKYIETLEKI